MNPQTISTPARPKQLGKSAGRGANKTPENPTAAISPKAKTIPVTESNFSGTRATMQSVKVRKETIFRLDAPTARNVALAADFTNWDQAPVFMSKGQDGVWLMKIPLPQGRHRYKFLVDGAWQEDPNCQRQVPNHFGTNDSLIEIT